MSHLDTSKQMMLKAATDIRIMREHLTFEHQHPTESDNPIWLHMLHEVEHALMGKGLSTSQRSPLSAEHGVDTGVYVVSAEIGNPPLRGEGVEHQHA